MEKKWYYQVWIHCNYDKVVNVLYTYKEEWLARQAADMRNAAVRHDTPDCIPPNVFYYVRPIAEDQLNEDLRMKFLRHMKRDKEYFLSHYDGAFKPYAIVMVELMKYNIETCDYDTRTRLSTRGGLLEGCRLDYDETTAIICSASYSDDDSICLEAAFLKDGNMDSASVKTFGSEEEILDWLSNTDIASNAVEDKLVEMFCDRYRRLGAFQNV